MANTKWQISGEYFETCSCDYLCPCIWTNMAGQPTKGYCDVALVFHIDQGRYGGEKLDGLSFAVVIHSPEVMGKGNMAVGLITDERGTAAQQEAIVQIASGQGGGPMAALGPLVGKMLGVEARSIRFDKSGLSRSVSIPGLLDQAVQGVTGASPDEPLALDGTIHPVNTRIALAKATRSHLHAFGINWDDTSGQNNGHFAPFNWQA
jgi:hypothetical protein